jgi:hypothetical protein
MIAGVTLCLTDNDEERHSTLAPPRRLASIAALLFLLGWIALSLAPGASSRSVLGDERGSSVAVRTVILEVTKAPEAFVVGWLIDLLLSVHSKTKTGDREPFQSHANDRNTPEQVAEEHAPSGSLGLRRMDLGRRFS